MPLGSPLGEPGLLDTAFSLELPSPGWQYGFLYQSRCRLRLKFHKRHASPLGPRPNRIGLHVSSYSGGEHHESRHQAFATHRRFRHTCTRPDRCSRRIHSSHPPPSSCASMHLRHGKVPQPSTTSRFDEKMPATRHARRTRRPAKFGVAVA